MRFLQLTGCSSFEISFHFSTHIVKNHNFFSKFNSVQKSKNGLILALSLSPRLKNSLFCIISFVEFINHLNQVHLFLNELRTYLSQSFRQNLGFLGRQISHSLPICILNMLSSDIQDVYHSSYRQITQCSLSNLIRYWKLAKFWSWKNMI